MSVGLSMASASFMRIALSGHLSLNFEECIHRRPLTVSDFDLKKTVLKRGTTFVLDLAGLQCWLLHISVS
jgi:hypothetical protein